MCPGQWRSKEASLRKMPESERQMGEQGQHQLGGGFAERSWGQSVRRSPPPPGSGTGQAALPGQETGTGLLMTRLLQSLCGYGGDRVSRRNPGQQRDKARFRVLWGDRRGHWPGGCSWGWCRGKRAHVGPGGLEGKVHWEGALGTLFGLSFSVCTAVGLDLLDGPH